MPRPDYLPQFWTVGTTAMTPEQSARAVEVLQAEFPGVYAHELNPARWFSLALDRWSAECLADALRHYVRAGGEGGLLEDVEAWLANQAEPYVPGEDHFQPLEAEDTERK